jgi:hypothetical protein
MPIQFTLFSRVPKRVIGPLAIGVFGSLMLGFMGTEFARAGIYRLSPSDVLPVRPGPRSVTSAYFASTRDSLARVPYIQSDVVEGPYLRLTIPLVMRSLLPRAEDACPDLTSGTGVGLVERPEREEPADPEYELALIACLSLIWTVRLDSASIEPPWDLHWSRDGKGGGLITYLRADGLSRGAHVLEVEQSPTPGEDDEQRPRIDYIRFRRCATSCYEASTSSMRTSTQYDGARRPPPVSDAPRVGREGRVRRVGRRQCHGNKSGKAPEVRTRLGPSRATRRDALVRTRSARRYPGSRSDRCR